MRNLLLILSVLICTSFAQRREPFRPAPGRGTVRPTPARGTARPAPGRGTVRPTPGRGTVRPVQGRGTVRPSPGLAPARPVQGRGTVRPSPGLAPVRQPARGSQVQQAAGRGQCPQGDGFYYSHERNCDMYYECKNGSRHEGICPDGLVFDDRYAPEKLRCELPFQIDCTSRDALQPPKSTEHCPRLWGLYAHENDCNRFWNCVEGHAYSFQCPEGLAYNEYAAHCDWPDQVENCDSETMLRFRCPQPTDEEIQYFGDPRYKFDDDCRKHYVCILTPDGSRQPRLLACDPGLVFNPETSSCDEAENVRGCENYYNNLDASKLRDLFG